MSERAAKRKSQEVTTPREGSSSPRAKKTKKSKTTPTEPDGPREVHKIELEPKDCPITAVTVYNDRAEIIRTLSVNLQAGDTHIILSGISHNIDTNSVRVAGAKGEATLLEVSAHLTYTKQNKDDSKVAQWKKTLTTVTEDMNNHKREIDRIKKEGEWLAGWAAGLMQPNVTVGDKQSPITTSMLMSKENLDKTAEFLSFYQQKLEDIDNRKNKLEAVVSDLQKESDKLSKQIQQSGGSDEKPVEEIVVVVTASAPTTFVLQPAYIVKGASWRASYDVRVKPGDPQLELTYYGNITNSTGEDWNEVNISLSTAQPAIGGSPPELFTKHVTFKAPSYSRYRRSYESKKSYRNAKNVLNDEINDMEYEDEGLFSSEPAGVLTTTVKESATSSSFIIPRKATIQSDKKEHKVTVKVINFEANYTYAIRPKLSPHVYLKANIINTEKEYPLLAGSINVFMDGNFVAKSDTRMVNPNEKLEIYLGTDPAIKFEYQPLKQLKDTKGVFQKTNTLKVQFNTAINNTKSAPVQVVMVDCLPKSNDTSITVELIQPKIYPDDDAITLDPTTNSIQWTLEIPPGTKQQVPFHYNVEYPSDKTIENAI